MKSENKLLSPELYNSILMQMGYGVIVSDKDGKFIMWNTIAQDLFEKELQLSEDDRLTYDFQVYSLDRKTRRTPDQYAMNQALFGKAVKADKVFVKNGQRPDGIYLKVSAFPVFDENNNAVKAAFVILEDITQEQMFYDSVINKITELESYLKKGTLN